MNPGAVLQAEATQTAARDLGLQVSSLDVRSPDEIAEALATAAKGRVGAVIAVGDPLTNEHRTRIVQLALHERLPVISTGGIWVAALGLTIPPTILFQTDEVIK